MMLYDVFHDGKYVGSLYGKSAKGAIAAAKRAYRVKEGEWKATDARLSIVEIEKLPTGSFESEANDQP